MKLTVLEGPKKRPCVYCKRVVTVGRRHKRFARARHYDEWCPGRYEPGEKEAKAVYVRAVHVLGRLAISGQWGALLAASRAVLQARGEK